MQIVIEIDEDLYEMCRDCLGDADNIEGIIANGTPLPKGHGRLIDADKLKTHYVGTELDTDLEVYLLPTIENAPTIIEADKERSDKE